MTMTDRLTDERLDALYAICVVGRHTDFPVLESDEAALILRSAPALIAEVRALREENAALRWLAKVVETSGAWLRSKSGPQPKAILAALAEWRRVRGE